MNQDDIAYLMRPNSILVVMLTYKAMKIICYRKCGQLTNELIDLQKEFETKLVE